MSELFHGFLFGLGIGFFVIGVLIIIWYYWPHRTWKKYVVDVGYFPISTSPRSRRIIIKARDTYHATNIILKKYPGQIIHQIFPEDEA
jgi:hypothetical protein